MMTSRERILAALAHQESDVLPIDFGAMRSTGIHVLAYARLREHLGLREGRLRVYDVFQQLAQPEEPVRKRLGGDVVQLHRLAPSFGIPIDQWKDAELQDGTPCQVPAGLDPVRLDDGGLGIYYGPTLVAVMPQGGYYYDPVHHPFAECKTAEDVDRIPFGEISDHELDYLARSARELRARTDCAILGEFGGNILEAGQSSFGYEKFMYLLAAEPDLVHHFCERLTAVYLRDLKKYLGAVGEYIDVVQMGDDLGSQAGPQISPRMYRQLIKPYHQAIYRCARETSPAAVFLHCCGGIVPLIPDLIDAGVQILNPVQISARGMDPALLKREFGRDLVFWGGGANMQYTVPTASPDQIRRETRALIEIFAPGGGYVFNQVHNIQANVAPEKILAIYDTALAYRDEQRAARASG
jgi:uroporphyrinogen decarboxylase